MTSQHLSDNSNEIAPLESPNSARPQTPPDLPPKNGPPVPPKDGPTTSKQIYTLDSLTATVLALRQTELYGTSGMNMYGDIFASSQIDLLSRLEKAQSDLQWDAIIRDYSDEFIRRNRMPDVEKAILAGIPDSLRPLVYLKTMRIRNQMEESTYQSVIKKAKLSDWESTSLRVSSLPEELQEFAQVHEYCIREVVSSPQEPDLTTKRFVLGILPLVAGLPDLSKPEKLALLFKFGAFINRASKDEFNYKSSRALEDLLSEVFLHITKQGVDLTQLFKSVLLETFLSEVDRGVLLKLLDFIVFEGIDFLVRVTSALFEQNKDKLLKLNNNELAEFVLSKKFLATLSTETLQAATTVELKLIKYENEFHLMSANAISGNDNELSNLKDANEDLLLRISDQKQKIESLKQTQAEILSQSDEVSQKLQQAQLEKEKLSMLAEELHAKYANLTMKENLNNTIKANNDISSGNADLEVQIAELEKKVALKKAKLEKLTK